MTGPELAPSKDQESCCLPVAALTSSPSSSGFQSHTHTCTQALTPHLHTHAPNTQTVHAHSQAHADASMHTYHVHTQYQIYTCAPICSHTYTVHMHLYTEHHTYHTLTCSHIHVYTYHAHIPIPYIPHVHLHTRVDTHMPHTRVHTQICCPTGSFHYLERPSTGLTAALGWALLYLIKSSAATLGPPG